MSPSQNHIPRYSINVPNALTILRILLSPVFVIALLHHRYGYALLVFAVAGISDGLDGFIAKHYNLRTVMGAVLDPIADKMLILSAYICLAVLDLVPVWLSVLVVSRDVIIGLGIAIYGIYNIRFQIAPSRISKLTTFVQIGTVLAVLIAPVPSDPAVWKWWLFAGASGVTVISGLHYIYVGVGILHHGLDQ